MSKSYLEWFAELGPFMHLVQKRLARKGQAGFDLAQAIIDDAPIKPPVILASKKDGTVQSIVGGIVRDGWLYVWFQCHNKNFCEMVLCDIASGGGSVKKLNESFNNCPSPYEGKSGSLVIASHWYCGLRRGIFLYRGKKIAEIEYEEKSSRNVLFESGKPSPTLESLNETCKNLGKIFPEDEVKKILEYHASSDTGAGDSWISFSEKKGCLSIKQPQCEYRVYLRNGSLYLVY